MPNTHRSGADLNLSENIFTIYFFKYNADP